MMFNPKAPSHVVIRVLPLLVLLALALIGSRLTVIGQAQEDAAVPKVGERLTYVISFNNYDSAGYAEIQVVSKGLLEGRQAVELSGKLKSFDLLSAAFFLWDEQRTTYIDPESGFPLYVKETSNSGVLPDVTVRNYLQSPITSFDLLSLIYKARQSGGSGSFSVLEGGVSRQFEMSVLGGEKISTEAGEFETIVSGVQSGFLTDLGITDFRVNLTDDARRMPVKIRFRTPKGEFEARLASIQDLSPKPEGTAATTPVPTPTPVRTPTPEVTPRPYVKNRALSPELPFSVGETLSYKVTKRGAEVAEVAVDASERDLYGGNDALRLRAYLVSKSGANDLFEDGDLFESWVDPDSLAPFGLRTNFKGFFSAYSQNVIFDQTAGTAIVNAGAPVQIPVGTHNLLSLAYAVRAFNLRGSASPTDPVNDTRVAVFLSGEPIILTLRPGGREAIDFNGKKRQAQVISVRTGTPEVDNLNVRLWLSADAARLPLRLVVGEYQADLLSVKSELPK